jgi:hypothetical protein
MNLTLYRDWEHVNRWDDPYDCIHQKYKFCCPLQKQNDNFVVEEEYPLDTILSKFEFLEKMVKNTIQGSISEFNNSCL